MFIYPCSYTVNLSLVSGQLHPIVKESVTSPLLNKPTVGKDQLSNYRLISCISLVLLAVFYMKTIVC